MKKGPMGQKENKQEKRSKIQTDKRKKDIRIKNGQKDKHF